MQLPSSKHLRAWSVTGGALALIALFSPPDLLMGYSLLGGNLGIATSGNGYQRDVRLFNNALDATNNDNQTADANYPGALGAFMSTWKAARGWASDAGPAKNFDFDWQGSTTSSLGNQNTVSYGTSGCGGGTLAYCETPIADGWRILMCESWVWNDGPGNPGGGQYDSQGVLTHELGHSLGLGHSTVNCGACNDTATGHSSLCAFICSNGVVERTPQSDDAAGLQAIYGAKPANKPTITSLSGSFNIGGTLIITGTNFGSTVNVKFTAGTTTNTGTIPGVVYNVPATATQVSVVIPATAKDGNVLVWMPGSSLLSNAKAIDIGGGGPPPGCNAPTTYGTGEANSVNGQIANISSSGGNPTVGNPSFQITLTGGRPHTYANLFSSTAQVSLATTWGTQYVGAPVMNAGFVIISALGTAAVTIPISAGMAGTTLYYQYLVTDTGSSGGRQHSQGLAVTFCP